MKKKTVLACSICQSRNYSLPLQEHRTERLELKKYCPKCNRHTLHKETV